MQARASEFVPGALVEAHVVEAAALPVRLDRFAAERFAALGTRSAARKAARRGDLRVDGAIAHESRFLVAGERVSLHDDVRPPVRPFEIPLELALVEAQLAIVVKPAGLATSGNRWRTLQNALPPHLPPPDLPDALPAARPVHRLDVRTGGLVAVARTAGAMVALSEAFAARQVHKRYVAVVTGRFEGERVVDAPVEGREARTRLVPTRYSPSLTCGTLTTVDCFPETGRTHQIRRHLAGLGHPILGDDLYGGEKVLRGAGLFLWAVELAVPRPGGGIARATWGPPPKLEAFLAREARRFSAYTA